MVYSTGMFVNKSLIYEESVDGAYLDINDSAAI